MTKKSNVEPSLSEAKKRLKEKSKEIKKRNIVPPVDPDEPTGLLSGGPESLDLEDDS